MYVNNPYSTRKQELLQKLLTSTFRAASQSCFKFQIIYLPPSLLTQQQPPSINPDHHS